MRITFLGTASGTPTRSRNLTSQALALENGALWLLDCGEAAQHQLMRANLKPGKIERVLITHLHGDHLFGLPGLLSCIAIHGRTAPVEVVGPVGLKAWLEATVRVSESLLSFPLDIRELDGAGPLPSRSGWQATAYPIAHRLACFGFDLREDPRPGRFDPARAEALGLPIGPVRSRLQHGETVRLPDGREIRPEAVCDPPRPGRHVVVLGDTSDASAIAAAAQGCDLLVREVTYDDARADKARHWGHSTSRMTGEFAHEVGAKTLIITHFSARFTDTADASGNPETIRVADLVTETARHCPTTRVLAAEDLWTFEVPRE